MEDRKRNQILLVLFIGVLMGALDIAIVGPALPAIQKTFGVGERALAWMFSIYVLFNLIGTPLMAKLSDLFGRRMVYVMDVSLFAAGSLLVALSPSFSVVLAGRAIQGFGAGGIFPVASAVIGDTFPPEKRGRALGLIGAVFGLAFIIGPILGGVLLLAGWQWLFIINLPIAAVVVVMSLRLLPSRRLQGSVSFDWAGMLVLAGLLACLAYGINQIDTSHFFNSLVSLNVLPFLVVFALLLVLFIFIERKQKNPILRLDLFRNRQMALAYILSAGAGFGEAGLVFMPALALAALGYLGVTKSSASFLLMPVVLAMGIGSPLIGRLLDELGSRLVILAGTATLAVGMFLLGNYAASMIMFILSGLLIGLGLVALLGAPLRYIMLNEASAADRSSAQGVLTLFGSVGQLMGASVVGAVAASGGGGAAGFSGAYLATGGIAVLLGLVALGLKNRSAERSSAVGHAAVEAQEV
jgi:EmrB/QacA subfamily drug resistance transporter